MAQIFIDESGKFTREDRYSVVGALVIPHMELNRCRHEVTAAAASWPRVRGELKGGSITTDQLGDLVDILFRRDALVQFCAADMSAASLVAQVEAHRLQQCALLGERPPANVLPECVTQLRQACERLQSMPTQLYAQCTAQTLLLQAVILDVPNYFAQRRPATLGRFDWKVDAKDKAKVTSQEQWWRDTLGPLLAALTRKRPMLRVDDPAFDYSHFDQNKGARAGLENLDLDVETLVTGNLKFEPSESDILLQVIDILVNRMRWALNQPLLDRAAIDHLARLQVRRLRGLQTVTVFMPDKDKPFSDEVREVLMTMSAGAREYFVADERAAA